MSHPKNVEVTGRKLLKSDDIVGPRYLTPLTYMRYPVPALPTPRYTRLNIIFGVKHSAGGITAAAYGSDISTVHKSWLNAMVSSV